jgi:hypothetical protein
MKYFFTLLLALCLCKPSLSQYPPGRYQPNIPPEVMEMIKKNMPPGTKFPTNAANAENPDETSVTRPLIQLPSFTEPSYNPEPAVKFDYSPFGSGRNSEQREAALAGVLAELNGKPYVLPAPESTPSTGYMLQMASTWNQATRKKFDPAELYGYAQLVTWVPRFDGQQIDSLRARNASFSVTALTNNYNKANLTVAVAAAVYALEPHRTSGANNLASALIAASDILYPAQADKDKRMPYLKDAESAFLYAISVSMENGKWGEYSYLPALNMGNLCLDLDKLEEARSLFMVARLIKPASWDVALGLAAYFARIGQPDKALAILEDDKLDKPQRYLVARKASKSLEKSMNYENLLMDAPEEEYKKGIDIMAAEPILTAAEFVAQIDQSMRNKMRYFIEHLPVEGSYSAPKIDKLTQYASVKAISAPPGISAMEDYVQMFSHNTMSGLALGTSQQLEWLSKMGLKIDVGIDMDDYAKHPEKYLNRGDIPDPKVSGMAEFRANIENMRKQAVQAQKELAAGKFGTLMEVATTADPSLAILTMNPEDYADPYNIIMQKINYTVFQRKKRLYEGYLYSVNRKTADQVNETIKQGLRKITEIALRQQEDMDRYEKEKEQAKEKGTNTDTYEWKIKLHQIHIKYNNEFNNTAETTFGSATNVATTAYKQKIKPMAEAYYYDVLRHISMVSDPAVREYLDKAFKINIKSNVAWGLRTVLVAHSAFSFLDAWDCSCDMEELLAQREAEQAALDKEENERIARNKAAKKEYDSGELPESKPLFKRLDAFADSTDWILFKVRTSCVRTVITSNEKLDKYVKYKSVESEFTGVTKRTLGLKGELSRQAGVAKLYVKGELTMNLTTDGNGVVKDFLITPEAQAGVEVGKFDFSVNGKASFDQNGLKDYSLTASASTTVKYGNTTVKGGAEVSIDSKGNVESDFSGKINHDFKNEVGGSGKVTMEASTKKGCSISSKIEQSLDPTVKDAIEKVADRIKDVAMVRPDTDFADKKSLWSGKWETKKKAK